MENERQAKSETASEAEKFDVAMRKILSVSKEELEKREKAWKRKKKLAKKKRAKDQPASPGPVAE